MGILVKHKVQTTIVAFCFLLIFLFVPGCSKSKSIAVNAKAHPDCDVNFTDFDSYYSAQRNDAISHIGSDSITELHTDDRGYDISAYYGLGKLCVNVIDSQGKELISVKTEYNLDLVFDGFAITDNLNMIALASDSSGRGMIANLNQGMTTAFYGVNSQYSVDDIKSFDMGYCIISENDVVAINKEGKITNSYFSDSTILGVSVKGKKLYLVESKPGNGVLEDQSSAVAYCQLLLKELDLPSMKLKRETVLNCSFNSYPQFEHYWDVKLFAEDNSQVLLSTQDGIFEVDMAEGKATTIVNTYDYGTLYPPEIVSDKGFLKVRMFFSDIDGNEKEVVSEIRPSDTPKKEISVNILGELSYESFFQYANRNTKEYYIRIDKTINGRFEQKDYIDIIANHSYDLIVFDDDLKDTLQEGNYLLNLNNLGIDKTGLNDGLSDLMEYCVFPEYSMEAYLYNSEIWSQGAIDKKSYLDSDAKEIFADQTAKTIVEEYYGIIQREIDTKGSLSQETVLDMLDMCRKYNKDYYETESMTSEIMKGSMVFNRVDIRSIEELYSYFCYYPHCLGLCVPWGYDYLPITSPCYIGICSSSKNVTDCVEILNLLLSEDVQKNMRIPVNKNALIYRIDNFVETIDKEKASKIIFDYALYSDSEWAVIEEEINETIAEITNGTHHVVDDNRKSASNIKPLCDRDSMVEFRKFSALLFSRNVAIYKSDKTIINILIEETNTYLGRKGDINETAKIICNRINTHVSETGT